MLLALRLARAFDRQHEDEQEQLITRIVTPVAKYWLCKRLPMMMAECMEVLGGNGFVEEAGPIARLYREAPLNGIWEGSGNVICLDVLRAMQKTERARRALPRARPRHPARRARLALPRRDRHRARQRTRARGPRAARHRDARADPVGVAARAARARRKWSTRSAPAGWDATAARRSDAARQRRVRDDHRAHGCAPDAARLVPSNGRRLGAAFLFSPFRATLPFSPEGCAGRRCRRRRPRPPPRCCPCRS